MCECILGVYENIANICRLRITCKIYHSVYTYLFLDLSMYLHIINTLIFHITGQLFNIMTFAI